MVGATSIRDARNGPRCSSEIAQLTQVTMLVVAWSVGDRITRRRRRQKKQFNRGPSNEQLCPGSTGESISRWAAEVPAEFLSPHSPLDES